VLYWLFICLCIFNALLVIHSSQLCQDKDPKLFKFTSHAGEVLDAGCDRDVPLTLFKTPKFLKTIAYIRHYGILKTLFKTEREKVRTLFKYRNNIFDNNPGIWLMPKKSTLFKTNSRKFYTLSKNGGAKNPTLASGTSPYSKYMGVPPGLRISFIFLSYNMPSYLMTSMWLHPKVIVECK